MMLFVGIRFFSGFVKIVKDQKIPAVHGKSTICCSKFETMAIRHAADYYMSKFVSKNWLVIKMGDIIFCINDGDYGKRDKKIDKIIGGDSWTVVESGPTIPHPHVTNVHFLNRSR